MEIIKEILIKNIRDLRKERAWTQEELAEKVGVSTGHLKSVETGRYGVSMELVGKFCEAFQVDPARLFQSLESAPAPVKDLPVSSVLKKLLAVPDDVYEKAQKVSADDPVWGYINDALDLAIERKIKKSTNHNHA